MMAERRLRDGHIEHSTRELGSVPEDSDDLQPDRIAERVQHFWEARLLADGVRYRPHRTKVRRISNKDTHTGIARLTDALEVYLELTATGNKAGRRRTAWRSGAAGHENEALSRGSNTYQRNGSEGGASCVTSLPRPCPGTDSRRRTTRSALRGRVARLRVATTTRRRGGEEWVEKTNYFTVEVYGAHARSCAQYLRGSRVVVDAELDWREWTDQQDNKRRGGEIEGRQVLFEGGRTASATAGDSGEETGLSPIPARPLRACGSPPQPVSKVRRALTICHSERSPSTASVEPVSSVCFLGAACQRANGRRWRCELLVPRRSRSIMRSFSSSLCENYAHTAVAGKQAGAKLRDVDVRSSIPSETLTSALVAASECSS